MHGTASHHVFEDHTGEVLMRLEAPTLAGLFEEAARGLSELMLAEDDRGPLAAPETVRLQSSDGAALLVDFLNELIFMSETRKRVYTDVTVTQVSERALEAAVRGVPAEALRTAVKAATLHDLRLEHTAEGYMVSIVLDV
jgi:SHS2 domain-containing protein